jgi:hypothetical protein
MVTGWSRGSLNRTSTLLSPAQYVLWLIEMGIGQHDESMTSVPTSSFGRIGGAEAGSNLIVPSLMCCSPEVFGTQLHLGHIQLLGMRWIVVVKRFVTLS